MVTCVLWEFNKLKNSIKRPAGYTEQNQFLGEIKHDFSPMALELTFEFSDPTMPPKYNYALIWEFKRYYFITGWAYVGGLWTADFAVDVLATYRNQIGEQAQYILRSQSDPNPDILDTTYIQSGGMQTSVQTISSRAFWGYDGTVESGCVVCGIVGDSGYNIGAVTYYAMTYSAFNNFMRLMLDGISWMGISTSEISFELQKALINPTQYIVSSIWLPIPIDRIAPHGVAAGTISLGWWSFNVSGRPVYILTNPTHILNFSAVINIDKADHVFDRRDMRYLRLSPYSRYSLQFFPFGVFEIDTSYLMNAEQLALDVSVSPMTGDAILKVRGMMNGGYYGGPAFVTESNVGVQLPTGQVAANIGNFSEALTAGGVAGLNDIIQGAAR